jgi:hypothetical protein
VLNLMLIAKQGHGGPFKRRAILDLLSIIWLITNEPGAHLILIKESTQAKCVSLTSCKKDIQEMVDYNYGNENI